MLKTNQVFTMRKDIPDISDSAYLLFCFILHRASGSKLEFRGKKYVILTGKNDPRKVFGWKDRSYWNYKKELTDNHLIRTYQKGNQNGAMVFPSYSEYKAFKESGMQNSAVQDSAVQEFAVPTTKICSAGMQNPAEPYKKKEILKNNKRAEPLKTSPSSLTPVRSFADLKDRDLDEREKPILEALMILEGKYNNLNKLDRETTFNYWSATLKSLGCSSEDMRRAVKDCYDDPSYKTFMPTADQFKPFAVEARRMRIEKEESEYYIQKYGGIDDEQS